MRRSVPEYDAIVVGSGMTGGWAAKELTELGLRTLVLDAGRPIVPNKDYREHTPPWEMPFRGLGDRQTAARRQAVQRNSGTFDEMSHQFWVDDVDNPVLDAREQGLSLASRAAGRWKVHHLGSPGLSVEQPRFRGEPARRHWRRLAHPLCGYRALVRSGRSIHRCEHTGQHESRDGNGADGARPEDVGAERLEPDVGGA